MINPEALKGITCTLAWVISGSWQVGKGGGWETFFSLTHNEMTGLLWSLPVFKSSQVLGCGVFFVFCFLLFLADWPPSHKCLFKKLNLELGPCGLGFRFLKEICLLVSPQPHKRAQSSLGWAVPHPCLGNRRNQEVVSQSFCFEDTWKLDKDLKRLFLLLCVNSNF